MKSTQDPRFPGRDKLGVYTALGWGVTGDFWEAMISKRSFRMNTSQSDEEKEEGVRGWLVQMGGEGEKCPDNKSLLSFVSVT